MAFKNKETEGAVTVKEIEMQTMRFNIVGISPFVPHAMSFKAAGSLLFPAPKKNAAERASTMKHEPFEEYVDACYAFTDDEDQVTRLYVPGSMFHAAISDVSIDMVGAKKAQVARLTSVPTAKLPLYGIPQIHCCLVRSSDMQRTPDIRTLPILPQWATTVEIQFVPSLIKAESIANLLSASGHIVGIGDGRPQKGKLANGQFRLCDDDDTEFQEIVAKQTRKAQDAALAAPEYFDLETRRLLEWFEQEKDRRAAAPTKLPKGSRQAVHSPQVAQDAANKKRKNGREAIA